MKHISNFDVIVCGSLHLDIIVNAPALPRIDETAVGSRWEKVCGGKGGNQAIQSANAGAKTAMLGCVGNDEFGETLKSNLTAANVDTTAVSTTLSAGSGMSVAILQDDGDYGAVIVSGSNLEIDPENIMRTWQDLGGAKVLILQNEVPHDVNVAAAKAARNHGAKLIFNAAPARKLENDLAELVDVLVLNRVEVEMISGLAVVDRASAIACLPALLAVTKSVVITLGGGGLVLQEHGGSVIQIEAIPVQVTSTHGAGDCFIGVLAAELAKGRSLELACRSANSKAATFVSRKLI